MQVEIDASSLGRTKWHEYAVRFVLGGLITAAAGVVARKFGPVIGGLFLAFPAIFPASATLVEKHEKQKKNKAGLVGITRGRKAASVDSAGSAMGSIGLLVFAWIVWRFLPSHSASLILPTATIAWSVAALGVWLIRKHV